MYKFEDKVDIKRYEYLIKARNFHYSNFNIWMVFFVVIIGGVFAGYCSLLQKDGLQFEKNILLGAGYFVSLFWHWSCKGYYYWVTNFMMLLCDCEKDLDDNMKVYSCFANKKANNDYFDVTKGANISTSKIVCMLSYFTAVVWAVIFFYKIFSSIISEECAELILINILSFISSILFAIIITYIANFLIKKNKKLHSRIKKHDDLRLD